MATDEEIEREIREKGLTAPRVTLESINAKIRSEYYFTAEEGVLGALAILADSETPVSELDIDHPTPAALGFVTFCALLLENGAKVIGINYGPVSAENFDQDLARKLARQKAIDQIWDLEGYLLRENLHVLDKPLTPLNIDHPGDVA